MYVQAYTHIHRLNKYINEQYWKMDKADKGQMRAWQYAEQSKLLAFSQLILGGL